jgi:hypothetical protein
MEGDDKIYERGQALSQYSWRDLKLTSYQGRKKNFLVYFHFPTSFYFFTSSSSLHHFFSPSLFFTLHCHIMDTEKAPSVQSKVEHIVDYEEDALSETSVNDFGRGNGSFMTAYFNVTCVSEPAKIALTHHCNVSLHY